MFPPSLHPPAARSLEDSRKGWFFGLLVYDGSRTVKALGGQVAGHTNKPKNQKTNQMCRMPPIPPPSPGPNPRTPERVGFLVFWFMMARGPSKPWEARELATPINQKTRKPTRFRECPPPSPPPAAQSLEDSRKGWFFGLFVYDGSRTVKVLGGQGAGHTNKPKN